jgi:hypothetical protein
MTKFEREFCAAFIAARRGEKVPTLELSMEMASAVADVLGGKIEMSAEPSGQRPNNKAMTDWLIARHFAIVKGEPIPPRPDRPVEMSAAAAREDTAARVKRFVDLHLHHADMQMSELANQRMIQLTQPPRTRWDGRLLGA